MFLGVCVSDLVENESLADVSPAGRGAEVVNQQEEEQHEGDASRGVDGVDEEHHDGAADDAQHARVPGEVTEGGPERKTSVREKKEQILLEIPRGYLVQISSALKHFKTNYVIKIIWVKSAKGVFLSHLGTNSEVLLF